EEVLLSGVKRADTLHHHHHAHAHAHHHHQQPPPPPHASDQLQSRGGTHLFPSPPSFLGTRSSSSANHRAPVHNLNWSCVRASCVCVVCRVCAAGSYEQPGSATGRPQLASSSSASTAASAS